MKATWTEAESRCLRTRARELARGVHLPRSERAHRHVLVVSAAKEQCALPSEIVHGVRRVRYVTPVLGARAQVAGLFVEGDRLLPIFHLRTLLDLPLTSLPEQAPIVLVGRERAEAGIGVFTIDDFREIADDEVTAVPEVMSARARALLRGFVRGRLPLVDADALLGGPALHVVPPPIVPEAR